MPVTRHVAWWNLENLFDEENSPFRTEKVKRTLGDSLKGWTPVLRDLKIKQLASVIDALATAKRPVVIAGRGAWEAGAADALAELADLTGALTATTALARGFFPRSEYDLGVALALLFGVGVPWLRTRLAQRKIGRR